MIEIRLGSGFSPDLEAGILKGCGRGGLGGLGGVSTELELILLNVSGNGALDPCS